MHGRRLTLGGRRPGRARLPTGGRPTPRPQGIGSAAADRPRSRQHAGQPSQGPEEQDQPNHPAHGNRLSEKEGLLPLGRTQGAIFGPKRRPVETVSASPEIQGDFLHVPPGIPRSPVAKTPLSGRKERCGKASRESRLPAENLWPKFQREEGVLILYWGRSCPRGQPPPLEAGNI